MLTWGMMFFSTESWKSGGGGRSSARYKNGEVVVLISVFKTLSRDKRMLPHLLASIDIKLRFLITPLVRSYNYLLRLDTEFTLE